MSAGGPPHWGCQHIQGLKTQSTSKREQGEEESEIRWVWCKKNQYKETEVKEKTNKDEEMREVEMDKWERAGQGGEGGTNRW